MKTKCFHHYVYIVLLDKAVLREEAVLEANPNRRRTKPCVYVGVTGLTPEERFRNHKKGRKASRFVCKYGIRLMPELYEYMNPMPYEAACQMEQELARDLREDGYTVTGGT